MAVTSSHHLPTPRCKRSLIEGYEDFYKKNGATHAITIALGIHPRSFDPETEFLPQLRRIAREIARIRGVPKRRLLDLKHEDAVWMAGFYEPLDWEKFIFPHWHGVISLRPGEESQLREVLKEKVGYDSDPLLVKDRKPASRPVISIPRAKPSFDLQPLYGTDGWVNYSSKFTLMNNPIHWTIADILPPRSPAKP